MTIQGHLVIHDLRREDSKRYVCRVTNKWGTIEKGITLKVQGKFVVILKFGMSAKSFERLIYLILT